MDNLVRKEQRKNLREMLAQAIKDPEYKANEIEYAGRDMSENATALSADYTIPMIEEAALIQEQMTVAAKNERWWENIKNLGKGILGLGLTYLGARNGGLLTLRDKASMLNYINKNGNSHLKTLFGEQFSEMVNSLNRSVGIDDKVLTEKY